MLETILVVLEAIASIALIVVVLLQSGKEAGLSSAISGSSESYLSKNKKGFKVGDKVVRFAMVQVAN